MKRNSYFVPFWPILAWSLVSACAGIAGQSDAIHDSSSSGSQDAGGGWSLLYHEDFEQLSLNRAKWAPDDRGKLDGPFGDDGEFFAQQGISAPDAFRASLPFGLDDWLIGEAYSRSDATSLEEMIAVVDDPAPEAPNNHVLRIKTQDHHDAAIIRSAEPLPSRYRVSVRVGYANYGDGKPQGTNGYDGDETNDPWHHSSSVSENGFYWLAILDAEPRPHNNIWIHHHRKWFMDSDNNYYPSVGPWSKIDTGNGFLTSGENPLFMLAVNGNDPKPTPYHGHDYYARTAGTWQTPHLPIGVDAYKPNTWYEIVIERFDDQIVLSATGDFRHGGQTTHWGTLDAAASCAYHFNQSAETMRDACVDNDTYPGLEKFPRWPAGTGYPDYFMSGDPHVNYYEGEVYYDDFKLEVWR